MSHSPSLKSNSTNNNNNDTILHVLYDYTSTGQDELTLKRGSVLEVLSRDKEVSGSEGWWAGRLLDDQSVGIFPANFVASSEPNLRIIDSQDLQIGQLIGVGGFGHVHVGKFGDVDVAIKTAKSLASFNSIQTARLSNISDNHSTSAVQKNLIEGLLREARLFSNLTHRNIIQLFGVSPSFITNRNLYLVMEYAHGGALSQLLQQRKSGLYPNCFIHYAKQIVDGMKYLHDEAAEHIIHRDLKCSNVLILEKINDIHDEVELVKKTLKITDFGLARKQLQSSSASTAGTYPWMSPECIKQNEFSTKSDVWSFGVILWECLTGEIPYKGFDQMQVAFGIAVGTYSLPIPSTCPEEFSQLMKDCWRTFPKDRPTFDELSVRISQLIESNYSTDQLTSAQFHEDFYPSLQEDWRREIQDIFEQLKAKEQEIHDREQAMVQATIAQNHHRTELEKWQNDLHEREMLIIERELKLAMQPTHQERLHPQTPKIHRRSGRFMRSLLYGSWNGSLTLSSTTAALLIGPPENFRHIISVSREGDTVHHHRMSADAPSSTVSATNASHSPLPTLHHSSASTPATPNLSRLGTLTSSGDDINKTDDAEPLLIAKGHFPVVVHNKDFDATKTLPLEKSSRCKPDKQSSGKKTKSRSTSSSSIKKHSKNHSQQGKAIWYISPTSANNDTTPMDQPAPHLENFDDTNSSSPSIVHERSLAHAFLNFNSVLVAVGLGYGLPIEITPSTPTIQRSSVHQNILRSASETETGTKQKSSSSSTNTTPSPLTKKQHKRTSSSPVTNRLAQTNGSSNNGHRARPFPSPPRPYSVEFPSIPPPPSTRTSTISQSDSHLDDYRNQLTEGRSISEENCDDRDRFSSSTVHSSSSQPQLSSPHLLDVVTEEQQKHHTKVLPPAIDRTNGLVPHDILERDFLR